MFNNLRIYHYRSSNDNKKSSEYSEKIGRKAHSHFLGYEWAIDIAFNHSNGSFPPTEMDSDSDPRDGEPSLKLIQ